MTKYLVYKPKQALLFPKYTVLPSEVSSRLVTFAGKEVLAVKHNLDNTVALHKAGIEVDHPMKCYYDIPKLKGKFDPKDYQLEGACFHSIYPHSFNLSSPRTGKTYTTLLTYDYLRSIGKVKTLVVFTTLSTMESAWCDSITNTFKHLKVVSVHAASSDKRRDLLKEDADIYVVNHDGVKVLEKELIALKPCMVIWDEADNLASSRNDIYKSFWRVKVSAKYIILATATPTSENKPTDAWALARLVNPDGVPKYFTKFRDMTMRQISMFKWVPLPNSEQIVAKALQPAYCVRKEDVMDLPSLKVIRKECGLSEQQTKMFKDMKNQLAADIGDSKLLALNGADMLTKCLQILLGVYKAEDENYEPLDYEPRVESVLECIKESPENKKVLIFCMFKGALRHYAKQIGEHYQVAYVDGDVNKKKRDAAFKAFAAKDGPKVLLAHPKTTAHGLEFAEHCNKIIWLGPISSGKLFTQANERIASMLQDSDMELIYIGANKFEWARYDQLEAKKNMNANVLDLCKTVLES